MSAELPLPLSPSGTRDLLARLGHHPKRFLGQNFLVDGNIVRKSIELAEVTSSDRVVEVGPGLGTLTAALLATGAEVWAVERDAALFAHLVADVVPQAQGRLHLLEGDAVEQPLAGIPTDLAEAGFKVVANLPYAISTPWMDAVLSGPLPTRMVLMLQLEAAQRYIASHGSKQFGAISIFLQAAYEIAPGHKVAAACFHPRPDVDSYLLHLVRKPNPHRYPAEAKALIRSVFQQRRKQIAALLRDRLPDGGRDWIASLQAYGLDGRARPEEIPGDAWRTLAAAGN